MVIDQLYAPFYAPAYNIVMLVLSLITYLSWSKNNAKRMLRGNNTNYVLLFVFVAFLILVIGHRPPSAHFGDSYLYRHMYNMYKTGGMSYAQGEGDWLYYYLQQVCSQVMDVEGFFTIVSAGYFGFMLIASIRIFKNNAWGGMIFLLGAFSTYSYAVNGIRNGLACSITILALSYAVLHKRGITIAAVLMFFAVGIHKTTALPAVCFVAAFFMRSTKNAIYFWIFSIFLNLVAHGAVESFFTGLGFDDRMTTYTQQTAEYAQINKSGFRPDFLLYSAMPIWLAYYVLVKRGIKNTTYSLIANTYIYANSFWVMMMQVSFSNRFAYLSWFILPIVLAYPCLRMNVWGDKQGQNAAKIMLAHSAFTFLMNYIIG